MKSLKFKPSIYELLGIIIIIVQTSTDVIGTMPVSAEVKTPIATLLMFLSFVFTGANQYFNKDTQNKSLILTFVLFIGYLTGGLADYLDIFHLSENVMAWVRWGLSMTTLTTSIISKYIFVENSSN